MAGRGFVTKEKAGFSECPFTLLKVDILTSFTLLHLNLTTLPMPNESSQMIKTGIYFNTTLDFGLSGRILELDHP
jgi:hypothetical protein